jgi:hemerythrin
MEAFHWNPCFITGLTEVDSQHRRLVDVINQFGNLVMRQEGASIAALDPIFAELAAYAQHHFVEEEALMMSVGLDAACRVTPKKHASFLDEVTGLRQRIAISRAEKSLLQFLTLAGLSFLGSDQLMARQIAPVQAGCRPEDAYLADTRTNDQPPIICCRRSTGYFSKSRNAIANWYS